MLSAPYYSQNYASIISQSLTVINKSTFEEHLKELSRPNSWATHIEVFAVATYFQAPIYFCVDPPCQKWECYKPVASSDKLRYPLITEPPFNVELRPKHFEVIYHANRHYSSVICANTGIPCTSPPPITEQVYNENKIIE